MTTTLKDVCEFLMHPDRTCDDYRTVALAFKAGQSRTVQRAKHRFHPGMQVTWTSPRTTDTYQGIVKKLGRSMIHVQVGKVVWRVSPGLLTRV